jgi:hypothetical protein
MPTPRNLYAAIGGTQESARSAIGALGEVQSGNSLYVDSVYGSNDTAARGRIDKPYLAVAAALAAAQAGDVVHVRPGTYPVTPFTIPANVSLVGDIKRRTHLTYTATGNAAMITMGVGSSLREITIELSSVGHHTLTGVWFDDATVQTAYLRSVHVHVDNAGAGAGASDVTGVLVQSLGTQVVDSIMFESTITVDTVGTGRKRCFLMDTSVADANLQHVDMLLSAPASIDAIGAEINIAGGTLRYLSGLVSVIAAVSPTTNADISQTAGFLRMGAVTLLDSSCKGLAFTTVGQNSPVIFGDPGGITGNLFLRPGGGSGSITEADNQLYVATRSIIQALSAHANTGPGGVLTCVVTVRVNGVPTTLTLTLTGVQTSGTDLVHAVEVPAGSLVSVHAADAGATTDLNVSFLISGW